MAAYPSGFVGHGSPGNALGGPISSQWAEWTGGMLPPESILVVSAHFERQPPTLSSTSGAPIVYDFYGFPAEMYELQYAPPPAAGLARRVVGLLPEGVLTDESRGLDHGAWVPLSHLFPAADVPVVQLSIPWSDDPAAMWELGTLLAPLRHDGVFILGSGNVVHNLGRVDWAGGPTPDWAADFDGYVAQKLEEGATRDLISYRSHPLGSASHPTPEHFVPLLVAAAAAADDAPSFPVHGWELGSISARSVQFGFN